MSDEHVIPPVAGAAHVNAGTATAVVPPRPALPPRPPLPPQGTVPPAGTVPPKGNAIPPPPPPLPRPATPASASTPPPTDGAGRRAYAWLRARVFEPHALLGIYVFVLTLIALWPSPVDGGARPFLRLVSRAVPVLTYARIEFGANILLFVPLGVLLALILRQRYLIVPIAFVATVTIESVQALLIDKRTPSVMDIIANLAGACIGLLIVVFVERRRARRAQT